MNKVENKSSKNMGGAIAIMCIAVIIAIFLLVFAMRGKTTTIGKYPENIKSESLSCKTTSKDYQIYSFAHAGQKEIIISAVLRGEKLEHIALSTILYETDSKKISSLYTRAQISMDKSFGKDGLGADALNAAYAKLDDAMRMSIYANYSEFNVTTAKYFLLSLENLTSKLTASNLKQEYEKQGFSCDINNN